MDATKARGAPAWVPWRVLLLLASSALALGIGEGAIRLLGHYQGIDYGCYLTELTNAERLPSAIWMDPRPGAVWQHYPPFRPGVRALAVTSEFAVPYQINGRGLRDAEHTYAKPAGVVRLLALGDSFTFGVGVPYGQRYTDVLERQLEDVEVVDMGVPGYGVDQALLAYLAEGRRYDPDLVLLFIHLAMTRREWTKIYAEEGGVQIPSDLAAVTPHEQSDTGTAYLGRDDPLFAGGTHRVLRHSHLLSFAWYRVQLWRLHDRLRADDERNYRPVPGEGSAYRQDQDPQRRRRVGALLARLAAECRAAGSELIVVNIDDHVGLDYVRDMPGLEYLDLSVELHRRNREGRVRYTFDRHYTPATHAYLGTRLTDWLEPRVRALRR